METPAGGAARPRFVGPGVLVAMTLVAVGSVLRTFLRWREAVGAAGMLAACAIGVVYIGVGFALRGWEQRRERGRLRAGTGVLVALAAVAVPLTRGEAWCMSLPIVALAILSLPRALSILLVAGMGGIVLLGGVVYRVSGADAVQETIGHASAFVFVVVFSRVALAAHRARLHVEELAAELRDANVRLQAHAAEAHDLATMKERTRIAREIHDGLGHYLTVVFVQLEAAEKLSSKDPAKSLAAIVKARKLTHDGLDEVRRAVSVLRGTSAADGELLGSLEALTSASRENGVDASLVVHGQPRPMPEATAFALYRAAQEALTNVSRHAKARTVKMALDFQGADGIALRVEDDGVGSDAAGGGFGLVGMRERVELCGGRMEIRTARGHGFALELTVPG